MRRPVTILKLKKIQNEGNHQIFLEGLSGIVMTSRLMGLKFLKLVLGLSVIVGSLQFLPVARPSAPVISEWRAPASIYAPIRRACYDCHSNETRWPWYSSVAPASWWVVRAVNRGRAELNFSNWNPLHHKKMLRRIEQAIASQHQQQGLYSHYHPNAILNDSERERILLWIAAYLD